LWSAAKLFYTLDHTKGTPTTDVKPGQCLCNTAQSTAHILSHADTRIPCGDSFTAEPRKNATHTGNEHHVMQNTIPPASSAPPPPSTSPTHTNTNSLREQTFCAKRMLHLNSSTPRREWDVTHMSGGSSLHSITSLIPLKAKTCGLNTANYFHILQASLSAKRITVSTASSSLHIR
jgi:hypothetical protein